MEKRPEVGIWGVGRGEVEVGSWKVVEERGGMVAYFTRGDV